MQTGTTDVEIQHSYSVTKSVAPTCTEDGYKVYTCGSCGDSYTETITATGHSYTRTKTVEATCAEDGYNDYLRYSNGSVSASRSANTTAYIFTEAE